MVAVAAYLVSERRWESATDVALMVLAIATIPLLVVESTATGTPAVVAAAVNWTIWGCFAVDLCVRTWLSRPGWRRYLWSHWYDVAIVVVTVIPYLLPLRALRSAHALKLLRVVRVTVHAVRIWHTATVPVAASGGHAEFGHPIDERRGRCCRRRGVRLLR